MITNELGLPQPFVDAATSDYKPTDKRYSVTRVLGGTCEAVLLRRHADELDGDVSDMVWAIFGSAVHQILQNAKETDEQLKENWLAVDMGDGYTLSGIFDLYDDSTGTVTDYKTTSVWKVIYGETEDWRLQTLAYCWMLRKTGFDAHRGEIVALIKDFSKRDAATKDGYPRHPVVKYEWDFTEEDFEAIEDRLYKWFGAVKLQEFREDAMLKPCNPEQRWHKDDKWAVMEKGKKRALRVLGSPEEAVEWAKGRGIDLDDGKHSVEYRRGEDTKCESYCDVRKWCPLYKAKVNEDF
jgi:hypothetical protein